MTAQLGSTPNPQTTAGLTVEEFLALDHQFEKDRLFLYSITEQVREEHPDSWISVYREKLVAMEPSLDALFAELDRQDIPRDVATSRWIPKEPEALIL